MKCIICNSNSNYFFSKEFNKVPYGSFMKDIGEVDYYKCSNCGFTISKTHRELSNSRWEKLNYDFHHYLENNKTPTNQPPYLEQAEMINILSINEVINIENAIDYAGGYGTLSKVLNKYFKLKLSVYDPFVNNKYQDFYIPKLKENYKTVINSALFEHLTRRKSYDKINGLVADDGCLIVHTLVCENIPNDSGWFYMEPPVHCAFHTNKSMSLLMKQWNYNSSIYCPKAKSWVLFKKDNPDTKLKVDLINKEFQTEYLIYKNGFVDYWK